MALQMGLLLSVMAITLVFMRIDDGWTNRRIGISIVTVILSCFSGFRSWWLGDCIKYYTLYRAVNEEGIINSVSDDFTNSGLRFFFRGMGILGISFDVCIFLIAVFVAVTLGVLIYRYSPAPYWSYLAYITMGFYMFTYSGLKQTVAMGFIVLAAMQIFEDHPIRFVILVCLGGLFHAPAFIFLAAYPIAKKRIDGYFFAILIASVVVLYFFRDNIVAWGTDVYYDEESKFFASELMGGKAVVMLLMLVISVYLRPPRTGDYIYCQLFNLMIVAMLLQTFSVYNNVFTRLANYYFQFIVLFLPLVLESGEHQLAMNPKPSYVIRYYNREIYAIVGVVGTVILFWYYYTLVSSGDTLVEDFMFFWQQDAHALYGQ